MVWVGELFEGEGGRDEALSDGAAGFGSAKNLHDHILVAEGSLLGFMKGTK